MRIFLGHYTSSVVGDGHAPKVHNVNGTKREPKERKYMYRGRVAKHMESKTTVFFISRLGKGGKGVNGRPLNLKIKWANFPNFGFYIFLITL